MADIGLGGGRLAQTRSGVKLPDQRQVSAYLGIAQRSLYRLIDRGELPAYQMGRVIRYAGADFRYPPRS